MSSNIRFPRRPESHAPRNTGSPLPRRSKIEQLPKGVRAEIDKRIVQGGFANYRALAAWLSEQGFELRKSAMHHHGQKLEHKLDAIKRATEQARAIVAAAPDDEGAMNDALIRLIQQMDFDILVDLEGEEVSPKVLSAITRSVASLARASVNQKKWMLEAREKLAAKIGVADRQVTEATKAGLSPAAAQQIRNALLDIRV
jgi:hypothetical protein